MDSRNERWCIHSAFVCLMLVGTLKKATTLSSDVNIAQN